MCRSKAEGGRRCPGRKGARSSAGVAVKGMGGGSAPRGPSGTPGRSRPRGRSSRGRRSRAAVLRDAQKQLNDLLDALVAGTPVDSAAGLVSAFDADVAGQVADAITGALEAHGRPKGSWESHLLCGALASAARAMQAGEDMAKALVTDAVSTALIAGGTPRLAARLAGRAAADSLMRLTPAQHWQQVRRAVELMAVSMCPNVADHPEVENYCLRPLASELLASGIQAELAESVPALSS